MVGQFDGHEGGFGIGLTGMVAMLVSLAFQVGTVALGVVVAWRWLHRPCGLAAQSPAGRPKDAFEILDDRFARGEIDGAEYESRRDLLIRRNS